jgi:hypothetical protein
MLQDLNWWHIHTFKEQGGKNHQKVWTGGHRSDRCQPREVVGRWPGTCAQVNRYASVCCRVTRHQWTGNPRLTQLWWKMVIWRWRSWETQHISINKSFMCCDQVWNEPHQVLNWIKCIVWEIQNISSTIWGGLIATLESLGGLTISSSDLVVLLVCASQCEFLISISAKKE